jgi:hypothetical protein
VANPGGEKLAREASRIHAGKFAKQIELAFSYDVNWIGDGEVITDVFVLDLIFRNLKAANPVRVNCSAVVLSKCLLMQ